MRKCTAQLVNKRELTKHHINLHCSTFLLTYDVKEYFERERHSLLIDREGGQKVGLNTCRKGDLGMYSDEQYRKALEVYEETKSVTKTITVLGYPARRQTMYNWINRKRILPA